MRTIPDVSRPVADEKGAVESDMQNILVIDGSEVLGYFGEGREEHSGENAPRPSDGMKDDLADNAPGDAGPEPRTPRKPGSRA
jgi:hypothetical protein